MAPHGREVVTDLARRLSEVGEGHEDAVSRVHGRKAVDVRVGDAAEQVGSLGSRRHPFLHVLRVG
jgi:hypothetical protein